MNGRTLFTSFEEFRKFKNNLRISLKNETVPVFADSAPETAFSDGDWGISIGAFEQEVALTKGMHIRQWNRSGRDWLDREEVEHEKRVNAQLKEYYRQYGIKDTGSTSEEV